MLCWTADLPALLVAWGRNCYHRTVLSSLWCACHAWCIQFIYDLVVDVLLYEFVYMNWLSTPPSLAPAVYLLVPFWLAPFWCYYLL